MRGNVEKHYAHLKAITAKKDVLVAAVLQESVAFAERTSTQGFGYARGIAGARAMEQEQSGKAGRDQVLGASLTIWKMLNIEVLLFEGMEHEWKSSYATCSNVYFWDLGWWHMIYTHCTYDILYRIYISFIILDMLHLKQLDISFDFCRQEGPAWCCCTPGQWLWDHSKQCASHSDGSFNKPCLDGHFSEEGTQHAAMRSFNVSKLPLSLHPARTQRKSQASTVSWPGTWGFCCINMQLAQSLFEWQTRKWTLWLQIRYELCWWNCAQKQVRAMKSQWHGDSERRLRTRHHNNIAAARHCSLRFWAWGALHRTGMHSMRNSQ